MTMKYERTQEFDRDVRKLIKKFPSLDSDLKIAKQNAIVLFHLQGVDNRGIVKIQGVGNTEELQFYKIRKFACKSLRGRGVQSGIRIVYAYFPNQKRVVFLEMYFKAQKENEDRGRMVSFASLES